MSKLVSLLTLKYIVCECVTHIQCLVCCVQLQEREWEDQLQLMRVQTDIAKKERDAQKLRDKMKEMGLHKYDE